MALMTKDLVGDDGGRRAKRREFKAQLAADTPPHAANKVKAN